MDKRQFAGSTDDLDFSNAFDGVSHDSSCLQNKFTRWFGYRRCVTRAAGGLKDNC